MQGETIFVEKLKETFGTSKPFFTHEILDLFNQYSRIYVFDLIKKAEAKKDIIKFEQGTYYIPEMTSVGLSSITIEEVLRKKYITDENDIYGIVSGSALDYGFGYGHKDESTIEIVTNNERSKKRVFESHGKRIILCKSLCEITKDNYRVYTLLQAFTQFNAKKYKYEDLCQGALRYANAFNITRGEILRMAVCFTAKTSVHLCRSDFLISKELKR